MTNEIMQNELPDMKGMKLANISQLGIRLWLYYSFFFILFFVYIVFLIWFIIVLVWFFFFLHFFLLEKKSLGQSKADSLSRLIDEANKVNESSTKGKGSKGKR